MSINLFLICLGLIYPSLQEAVQEASVVVVVLNDFRVLCPKDTSISIIKVLEVFLREFELHLALFALFVVLIVAVFLWSFVHFDEFQENAVFLEL
jgi:hypothetical protein